MLNPRFYTLACIVVALVMFRVVPHPPNVSPIAAMALFAGAHFSDKRVALLIPMAALLLSDLVIGIHSTMLYVYMAFAMAVLIGIWLRSSYSVQTVTGAAVASSLLFFVITNFGSWLSHDLYPKTWDGLLAAYSAGLPFYRNTLIGDLCFTLIVFGGFWLAQKYLPVLRERVT